MLMAYTGLAHVNPAYAGDVLAAWAALLTPANGHVIASCGLKSEPHPPHDALIIFNMVLVEESGTREDFIRKAQDAVKQVHPKLRFADGKPFAACTEPEQESGYFYPVVNISMTTNDTAAAHAQFSYWSKLP